MFTMGKFGSLRKRVNNLFLSLTNQRGEKEKCTVSVEHKSTQIHDFPICRLATGVQTDMELFQMDAGERSLLKAQTPNNNAETIKLNDDYDMRKKLSVGCTYMKRGPCQCPACVDARCEELAFNTTHSPAEDDDEGEILIIFGKTSVGTSPMVQYFDKFSQTEESFSPQTIIKHEAKVNRRVVQLTKETFRPTSQATDNMKTTSRQPTEILEINFPSRNPLESWQLDKLTHRAPKTYKYPRHRERDFKRRMMFAIGDSSTLKILKRLQSRCNPDKSDDALYHVINTSVNQFKRNFDKLPEQDQRSVLEHEDNFIINLKSEILRLGQVLDMNEGQAVGLESSANVLSDGSELQQQKPKPIRKAYRRRLKSTPKTQEDISVEIIRDSHTLAETATFGIDSEKVMATGECETHRTKRDISNKELDLLENSNDVDPGKVTSLSDMQSEKPENGCGECSQKTSNSSSAAPLTDLPEAFDRGIQYRMDDQPVFSKGRKGFKMEARPQKVKRRGIPNKHLRSTNTYLQENAADVDIDKNNDCFSNQGFDFLSTNILAENNYLEEITKTQDDVNDVPPEKEPEVNPFTSSIEEPTELEDNRHLQVEPAQIFLRKKGDFERLEEKYAVSNPKRKGPKRTKKRQDKRATNILNLNNNADDDFSDDYTDDEDYDDTDPLLDECQQDFMYMIM